ncbi:MAG: HEAT repeat domain-containing protein, partial [Dehalococcoidia bacterium]
YVESALNEHPAEDREVAKGVLIALVTSEATKAAFDLNGVASRVGAEQSVVERVLFRLTGQRLVRWVDEYGAYELAHEVLVATIAAWINDEERQLKQTRELLLRELADWQQNPAVFLSQSKFQHINGYRDILPLTDEEITFLLSAAIVYGEEVPYWLERMQEQGPRVRVLLDMLRSEVSQARHTAARYLVKFPEEGVAMALAKTSFQDPDPAVRDMAAVSLGRMGGRAGINLLLETAKSDDHLQRSRSLYALALVLDVSPDVLGDGSAPLQRKAYYELGKIRFWRNWPRIRKFAVAGAVGGAVGFGFGLSPPIVWHSLVLYQDVVRSITDMVFIVPVFAIIGLLAGAGIAMGASVGESLLSGRVWLGRVFGGTILGGLAFTIVLSPLTIVDASGALDLTLTILGSGLFGMSTGLGLTVALAISPRRAFVLPGAAIGAAFGIVVFGILGYVPFQIVPTPSVPPILLLASGGLVGLVLAISMVWAETSWPVEVQEGPGEYFLPDPKGLPNNTDL